MNKAHKITAKEIKELHKQTFAEINNASERYCHLLCAWMWIYLCVATLFLYVLSECDIKYNQNAAWGFIIVVILIVVASLFTVYLECFISAYKRKYGSSDHISDG